MTLIVKRVKDGWIVCRSGSCKHSHFRSKSAAVNLKQLLIKGIMPKSPYYLESARRLLTEDEFKYLKVEHKQKYVNRGGYGKRT